MRAAATRWRTTPLPRREGGAVLLAQQAAPAFIAAAVFLAPYISRRPFELMLTVSDMLFFCGAGLLLLGKRLPSQPLGAFTVNWLMCFLLMLFGLLVGSLVNGDPIRWLVAGVQYGFTFVVLPFLLMGHGEARTISLAKALVLGVFCMELFGATLYYGWDGSYEDFKQIGPEFVTGARRLGAFLADANWNSAVVAMTMPFVFFLRMRRKIGQITAAVALGVLALGIILSASFTGFASGVIAIVIFMLVGGIRPSLKWVIAGAGAATMLLATYGLPQAFEKRVAPALEQGDVTQAGTYAARVGLIGEAWEIVDNTTFVGIGVDQYRTISAWKAPVHNMYLLLWAEGGVLSLLGWIGMMLVLLAGAALVLARDRLASALAFSVLSTFLITSTASPHMYARVWLVPIFIAMAFVFEAMGRPAERPRPDMRRG
jgi:O-antigen ligase